MIGTEFPFYFYPPNPSSPGYLYGYIVTASAPWSVSLIPPFSESPDCTGNRLWRLLRFCMEHTCPRCRKLFDCRADQIGVCPCVKVTLSPEQQRFIQSQYVGCLCPSCLMAFGATTGPVFSQST